MTGDSRQDFAFAFLSILFEGVPFILLGTLISGFIDVYMPSGMMDRFLPKNNLLAVMTAGLLGAVFPVCECAVVPVIRRLVKKGLPVSCAFTYMLAAPIVNPITAFSTWKAFSGNNIMIGESLISSSLVMTLTRLGLGYFVAVLVGAIVSRISLSHVLKKSLCHDINNFSGHAHEHENHDSCCGGLHELKRESSPSRLVLAMRSAMKDFIDVGVYFTIGVAITALFNTGIAPGAEWLNKIATNHLFSPFALMVLAFLLSLCSTSDAFVAATLDKFSYGAKLAFLVFGPMMDMKLMFLYQSVMKKKFIVGLAVSLFLFIGILSYLFQVFLNQFVTP
jgi:uncharacterized protein